MCSSAMATSIGAILWPQRIVSLQTLQAAIIAPALPNASA
jgi:hypothetical protein